MIYFKVLEQRTWILAVVATKKIMGAIYFWLNVLSSD